MDCILFYGFDCGGEQDCLKEWEDFDENYEEWENCEWKFTGEDNDQV